MEKGEAQVQELDRVATNVSDLKQALAVGDVKTSKVKNVAFADAIAKDNPKPWSASMLKLYAVSLVAISSHARLPELVLEC
jgi:hypothetical protein